MKILGIIAEYNPLHNGHIFHMQKAKKNTNAHIAIAAITGNFAQRGLPAKLNKYSKTQIALENGIDIVIEIPTFYGTASAEHFARYSVKLLELSGINALSFGAECTEIEKLLEISSFLEKENALFTQNLKENLKKGLNFPKAREKALDAASHPLDNSIINHPNNILAIEYLKYLPNHINPYLIERNQNLTSATKIGELLKEENWEEINKAVPPSILEKLKLNRLITLNDFSQLFHYSFKNVEKNSEKIFDLNDELYNRIKKSKSFLLEDLIEEVACKNYTKTRIQRALVHTFLNIKKEDITYDIPFIRILGFRKEKQDYLKEIEKNTEIITNIKNKKHLLIEKEIFASDVFYGALGQKNNIEYKFPVVV
ncbi:MAG: nucleotidyltransferase family protein [Defluviitaleaceae bacterium]|nr:nucleotidyltransferase family protein [Defluviitaleaceae bacterium]